MYESTLFTLGLIFFAVLCIGIGVWLQGKEQKKKQRAKEESRKAAAIQKAKQDDIRAGQAAQSGSSGNLLGTTAKVAVATTVAASVIDWPDTDYGSSGSDSGFGDD